MKFKRATASALLALILVLTATVRAVESTWEYSVQVSSSVQVSPAQITLSWPQDTNGTPSSYTIYRKAPSATSWGSGTTIAGGATSYTDTSVSVGTVYEYRIVKAGGSYTGYGYVQSGINAPLVDSRGKVVLIVDNSIAGSLTSELARLQQDLAGDGWTVLRHDVSRSDSPVSVKNLIISDYNADRANVKSVFLFGHVPVPYSGQLNPDGHGDHVGAWPADVYYGDIDGSWTDNSVNFTQSVNTDPKDAARLSNYPGDGKFDQTQIPSNVELEVGRVDLSNLPGRTTWGGPATFASETELLRKYLNKDHNFRHRITNPARRAVVGDYFGVRGGEAFAASGFRSFAPLVGASSIRNLNVEFNDTRGVWIPQVAQNEYLLAYACGAGSYASIAGIGSGVYNGGDTVELVNSNVRGVFNLLFGSWLGDWDSEDNILRAPLATDTGLVAAWSGRPHWFMHPMGLGETVGYAARLTQNNNGLYETAINSSANRIHVALMGDPTLRLHPVAPVASLSGSQSGSTITLNWQASSDSSLVGYHVYRADSASSAFARLTGSPISSLNYNDSSAPSGAIYMVRAIKLENASSGSYQNASQGIFWSVSGGSSSTSTGGTVTTAPAPDTSAPSVSISGPSSGATVSGTSVAVTANASDNVAVAGVQFKLDGANLGSELASAPFSVTLNSTTLSDGAHTVSAVARDAAGNMASASSVSFTVSNPTASTSTTSTTTAPSTSTSTSTTTTSSTLAGVTLWFDDALPAGAGASANGGDSWNWVTSSPAPISGSKAHQTAVASGLHEHAFNWATPFNVATGEVLVTYVYLDPSHLPTEIMLSWAAGNWEHRAYWGADKIGYGDKNTAGRFYAGALPVAGQWVRLEVPASAVGLEGQAIQGMGFSTFDGRVTFDATGKALPGTAASTTSTAPTTSTTTSSTTTSSAATSSTTAAITSADTIWFDDAVPAGAGVGSSGGDTWNWVSSPTPVSGSKAHQTNVAAGIHEHSFNWAAPFAVATGDKLFVYVYLDAANPPTEIMLNWCADSWEHRAYWGADKISYGTKNTAGRFYAGALPATGQWVRLEVPASSVGLEGQNIQGICFSAYDGRVTYDATGKASAGTSSTPTATTSTSLLSAPTTSTNTVTDVVAPTTTTTSVDTPWFDDALPAGAGGSGSGGDGWNWITSSPAPVSGSKAHQTNIAAGLHEHAFNWATPLAVATGDKLYAYVYLDPSNLPTEIMLSWVSDSWEHRAYWGADKIGYGTKNSTGRFYAGALPVAGQWVRLEVSASSVGLEGHAVQGMGFSTFDGRVTYDVTGKATAGTSSTSSTSTVTASFSYSTPTSSMTTTATGTDFVWIDDAVPTGAGVGSTGGDSWNWVSASPAPFSGTKAHQSSAAAGLHEHGFNWASTTMTVGAGDTLYTYVYIDPANPVSEIMLSWGADNWEHRAYWGADKISYGTKGSAGRYYAGALPAAGQWVRLEIPASAVGLEGLTVQAMSFSTYDGRVTYDKTGKVSR